MKKILITVAAGIITSVSLAQIQSLEIGSSMPMADKTMKSVDGKEVSLDKARTKNGLLVMFSCNTCPYVIKSQDRTKEMMKYAAGKGIGMVVINSNEAKRNEDDSYEAMKEYGKKQSYSAPYVVDQASALADAFGATRTPEVFLFDKDGKLVYKGAMEDNPSNPGESKSMYLKDAMDNMLTGKQIEPNTTKSIGCTIKRNS